MKTRNKFGLAGIFVIAVAALAIMAGLGYLSITIQTQVYVRDVKDLQCQQTGHVSITKDFGSTTESPKEMIINCPVQSGTGTSGMFSTGENYYEPGTADNCHIYITPHRENNYLPFESVWLYDGSFMDKTQYVIAMGGNADNYMFDREFKIEVCEKATPTSKVVCTVIPASLQRVRWNEKSDLGTVHKGGYIKVTNNVNFFQDAGQFLNGGKTFVCY